MVKYYAPKFPRGNTTRADWPKSVADFPRSSTEVAEQSTSESEDELPTRLVPAKAPAQYLPSPREVINPRKWSGGGGAEW